MPGVPITSWVHGISMQAEYQNRLTSVRHIGPFARIEGSPGQNTWLHFPVPTPAVSGDGRLKLGSVLLNFRTRTPEAWVHEVVVYDGAATVAEFRDLHLTGDHPSERFAVAGQPDVQYALNITVGVQFGPQPPTIQAMTIEFIAAGCEFLQ